MKIKPTNIRNIARLYQQNMKSQRSNGEGAKITRQDVVEISKEGAKRSEFEGVVRSVAAEVSRNVSAETLKRLRQQVDRGEYSVSSQDIARAILTKINILNGEENE